MSLFYEITTSDEFKKYLEIASSNFTILQANKSEYLKGGDIPYNSIKRCEIKHKSTNYNWKPSEFISFKRIGNLVNKRRKKHTVHKLIDLTLEEYRLFIQLSINNINVVTTIENYYNNTYNEKWINGDYALIKSDPSSLKMGQMISEKEFIKKFDTYFMENKIYNYISENYKYFKSTENRFDGAIKSLYDFFKCGDSFHYIEDNNNNIDKIFKSIVNMVDIVKKFNVMMPDYKTELLLSNRLFYTIYITSKENPRINCEFLSTNLAETKSGFKILDLTNYGVSIYDVYESFMKKHKSELKWGSKSFPDKYIGSVTRTLKIKSLMDKAKQKTMVKSTKKEKASTM